MNIEQLASQIDGRKDLKAYWDSMMDGQDMPQAIKNYINEKSYEGHQKGDYHSYTINPKQSPSRGAISKEFNNEFDPKPNRLKYSTYTVNGEQSPSIGAIRKDFNNDFDPKPNRL